MHTVIAFVADGLSAIEHQSRPKVVQRPGIYRISVTLCRPRILVLRPHHLAYSFPKLMHDYSFEITLRLEQR